MIEISNIVYNNTFQSHYRSDFNLKVTLKNVSLSAFQSHYRSDFNHLLPQVRSGNSGFQSHYRSDFNFSVVYTSKPTLEISIPL